MAEPKLLEPGTHTIEVGGQYRCAGVLKVIGKQGRKLRVVIDAGERRPSPPVVSRGKKPDQQG